MLPTATAAFTLQERVIMAKRADRLLAQIEQDVLDESKPLASALRKCVILGGNAASADLREWATRELHGYLSDDDKLPDYRYIAAPLLIDGTSGHYEITGEEISVLDLPEIARDVVKDDMAVPQGVGEIEAMIRQAEAEDGFLRLGMPGGAELARLMTHELGTPTAASRASIGVSAPPASAVSSTRSAPL
jgi:hypothetical protein